MNIWILCLLCVVQGLTEFLPVSSSGHLFLLGQLFGIRENLFLLNLFLHLATLLAVVILYRKVILKILKKPFQIYNLKLVLSTIVTVAIALLMEYFKIENISSKIYCFGFLITSILLIFMHIYQKNTFLISKNEVSFKDVLLVGAVQGIATIPGISRSGSTISTLLLCGNNEDKSAEFSFLLSIPVIVGGFVFELIKCNKNSAILDNSYFALYFFAFLLTFFVSIISLKLTLKMMKSKKFNYFAVYTFIIFIVTFIINYLI